MSIQDVAFEQDSRGNFDLITTEDEVFDTVEGMETAFYYQLFTDIRINKEYISRPLDRGGWIGDLVTKKDGYQSGSMLFLKQQARYTTDDVNEAVAFAIDALNYFVMIKAAKKVDALSNENEIVGYIYAPGSSIQRYSALWKNTKTTEITKKQRKVISGYDYLIDSEGNQYVDSEGNQYVEIRRHYVRG